MGLSLCVCLECGKIRTEHDGSHCDDYCYEKHEEKQSCVI